MALFASAELNIAAGRLAPLRSCVADQFNGFPGV